MNANLLSLAQEALGADFSRLAAPFLGESQGATQSALSALLPAVIGASRRRAPRHKGPPACCR